jgi:eukaryotic-like serine/threonine-protein kinase
MSTAVFAPGHVVAGRYRIQQLLGQGGMGSVYRAQQLSVGRSVALKLLSDEHIGSVELFERFQREAIALARLAHPNTVRLFDFGTSEGGCPFLVMELLRGTDLSRDLEQSGPLRYDHALRVARQILCSLSEAHGAGIVHRDVKPANVFLCAGSSWPLVKVLDFGIVGDIVADPVAPRLTRTGTVLGSVAYMSPEQAQGLAVGPASDLYAVGVVLFEMLTRRTLFDPRVCTAQLLAKVMEPAPRLHDVDPELCVPAELEALVADLVERDASRRPASARAVIERIDALLDRAALPPLVRAVADASSSLVPSAGSTLRGVAKLIVDSPASGGRAIPPTEPMLLPHTASGGGAPRTVGGVPPASRRRARRLAATFTLLAVGAGAAGAFVGPLRSTPVGQAFAAAAAPLIQTLLPDEPRRDAERRENTVGAALPSSADAPPEDLEGGAASGALAAVAPPAEPEAVALAALLPASPALELEVPPSPPPRASTPAVAAKPAPTPAPSAPRRRPSRPAAPSPKPHASSPASTEPAPTPASTEPAPAPASTEPAPALPVSAVPLPSHPGTLILPETLGSAATEVAPASVGTFEPAREPATPSELERPAAPPTTLSPSTEPGLREPAREAARRESGHAPPPSSLAAVEAAHQAGEISRQERDELVAVLRQLQADARARALGAYREGRITRRELWLRQREIDRELEGEPAYRQPAYRERTYREPAYRERTRARIRLRW